MPFLWWKLKSWTVCVPAPCSWVDIHPGPIQQRHGGGRAGKVCIGSGGRQLSWGGSTLEPALLWPEQAAASLLESLWKMAGRVCLPPCSWLWRVHAWFADTSRNSISHLMPQYKSLSSSSPQGGFYCLQVKTWLRQWLLYNVPRWVLVIHDQCGSYFSH